MVSDLHVVSESSMTTKEENCFESELTWTDSKHQLGCLAQGFFVATPQYRTNSGMLCSLESDIVKKI